MDEGVFRVLRALVERQPQTALDLVHSSGEAPSVVREVRRSQPTWFTGDADEVRLSMVGVLAVAREAVERARPRSAAPEATLLSTLITAGGERGPIKRELDQVWSTPETALRRGRLLVEEGEAQRGLCFLGDDDMTSLATHLQGASRPSTVIDIDPDLLRLYERWAARRGWGHRSVRHDLRDPVPKKLRGRFGCVFTDPPYAVEGFELFVSRAIDLLRDGGRLYVNFGASRRSPERGLEKQRVLARAGLLVEAVWPDFNEYEGAAAIGARSNLWRCRVIPQTRATIRGREEGELYTRRSPR